jgi:polyphosphate kinase 2 (PPK2 family)
MLETVDLKQRIDRAYYRALMPELEIRASRLQRAAIEARVPIILVFEGWEGAGKGVLINRLIRSLDPRHYQVFPITRRSRKERVYPFLWRYWNKLPPKGRMSVFDRSWYAQLFHDRARKIISNKEWRAALDDVRAFERTLTAGGYLIIKLFLHITEKEQRKRLEKLERDPATAWRVTKDDWAQHRRYDKYLRAADDVLQQETVAPWHVVEAMDRRVGTVRVFRLFCGALESTIADTLPERIAPEDGVDFDRPPGSASLMHTIAHPLDLDASPGTADVISRPARRKPAVASPSTVTVTHPSSGILDRVDLSPSVTREEYDKQLKRHQKRMRRLHNEIYRRRIPLVVVYEGWDAAGKGGNIRRLTQSMDPRGYDVLPVGPPSGVEKRHHYLWRFWRDVPKAGHVAIFDRSWYGRVLVERVERLTPEADWRRAYDEINEMESQWVGDGIVLVKFWLHIDKDTQLARFEERQHVEHKNWKITEEDWRNRRKWDLYKDAAEEMLARTHTEQAPWTIVESNCKHFARLKSLRTVIEAVERALK